MTTGTLHTTWLSLIDRSGPFLSVQVLESALPQGLEAIQAKFKQKLRLAYEEWRDAVDNEDPQLAELHREWIKLVLGDILEYDNTSLLSNSSNEVKYLNEELASEYVPAFVIKSPASDKIRFFIDVLPPEIDFDKPTDGAKWPTSTVEKMILLCRSQKVRYGLITNGEKWTIVSAPIGATSGTATWYSRLWRYEPVTLKAFQTLLGVRRCFGADSETLDTLLDNSLNSYEEVTNTLGEQVRRAVEVLIQSLDSADQDRNRELLDGIPPSELYDASVTVMMRLVFLLCAEERGLLLLGDPVYDQFYAVATLRAQLAEEAGKLGPEVLERRHDAWSRLLATFRVVYGGIEHETLRLPPLGGSLFNPDKYPFLEGRKAGSSWKDSGAAPLPIDNRTVLLLLTALQVLEQKGGALHLSYRSLDVEQIGHVYEGLLDSTVSRVPTETLALIGSKQTKSTLLSLSDLEFQLRQGKEALSSYLEEKLERKSASLLKALNSSVSDHEYGTLILACGGDESLATRIKPLFHLLQTDIWGHPLVYKTGSYAVTKGLDRKETGTHYTPRSLTEHIVSLTLEPLVFNGVAEGLPRTEWTLKSSDEILKIKVCDPTMGSAAFLVQVCRFLSEHLVLAWDKEQKGTQVRTSVHDQLLSARRLIAEKCLYGIDKNPLAVELSKLSIWLVTLSKGKPFDFLDHNLKAGDSLLGIHSLRQLIEFDSTKDLQISFFDTFIAEKLSNSLNFRKQIRDISINEFSDVRKATDILEESNKEIQKLKLIADVVSTINLDNTDLKSKPNAVILKAKIYDYAKGSIESESFLTDILKLSSVAYADNRKLKLTPFHWPLEFPEVFVEGGFSAFVGNPPFLGNKYWKSMLGGHVQSLAKSILNATPGKVDICLVFHRRICSLLQEKGTYGLLSTNNIAEGSALAVGLDQIVKTGNLFWTKKGMPWPGKASVSVAIICFFKGEFKGPKVANNKSCNRIGSRLEAEEEVAWSPKQIENGIFCFAGVDNGSGLAFLLDESSPWFKPLKDEKHSLLRPYVSGEDITKNALYGVKRWALDLGDSPLENFERSHPIAYSFLIEVVKPTRTEENLKGHEGLFKRWWQFARHRANMVKKLREKEFFIAYPKAPKYAICMLAQSSWIYTNKVIQVGINRDDLLAICYSSPFSYWIEKFSGGKLGKTSSLTLSVEQAFQTFPCPLGNLSTDIVNLSFEFNTLSLEWCKDNGVGLTAMMDNYNSPKCNDPKIVRLRVIREQIDKAVFDLYQWEDVSCGHDFVKYEGNLPVAETRYGISDEAREKMIFRLLELNKASSGHISVAKDSEEEGE